MTGPSLMCISCGYALEGLSAEAACPECGTPIAATRRTRDLANRVIARPAAAQHMLWKISLADAASAVVIVCIGITMWLGAEAATLGGVFLLIGLNLFCRYQWQRLLREVPAKPWLVFLSAARTALAGAFGYIGLVGLVGGSLSPLSDVAAVFALLLLLSIWCVLSAVGNAAESVLIWRLVDALNRPHARRVGISTWLSLLCFGLAVVTALVGPHAVVPLFAAGHGFAAATAWLTRRALAGADA
ncbi:MAG: hypothetical protein U0570_10865 [Phycisphaerales bacterium]